MSDIDWITEPANTDGRLTRLANVTHGIFTFQQAGRAGITPADLQKRVEREVLEEFDEQFVYRHLASTGPWFEDSYREAWVSLHPSQFPDERTSSYRQPREIISGQWALSMQGPYPMSPQGTLLTAEPLPRVPKNIDVVVHPIRDDDWQWISGLPVARPATAIADMILALDDDDLIRGNVRDAIRIGDIDIPRLIELIDSPTDETGRPGRSGEATFRYLFGDGDSWISRENVTSTSTLTGDDIVVTAIHPLTTQRQ